MVEIVRIRYKTPKGEEVNGKFIKTSLGYIPIFFENNTYLGKENKILSEEPIDFGAFQRREINDE